jgi:hypothetical protein
LVTEVTDEVYLLSSRRFAPALAGIAFAGIAFADTSSPLRIEVLDV